MFPAFQSRCWRTHLQFMHLLSRLKPMNINSLQKPKIKSQFEFTFQYLKPLMMYAFFCVIPWHLNSDARELPKRKHITFRTQWKFEIKNPDDDQTWSELLRVTNKTWLLPRYECVLRCSNAECVNLIHYLGTDCSSFFLFFFYMYIAVLQFINCSVCCFLLLLLCQFPWISLLVIFHSLWHVFCIYIKYSLV